MSDYINDLKDGLYKNNYSNIEDLQYLLDQKAYMYGKNFINNYDEKKENFKFHIKIIVNFIKFLFNKTSTKQNLILNSAYFNLENSFTEKNIVLIPSPWKNFKYSFILWYKLNYFLNKQKILKYEEIISKENLNNLNKIEFLLESIYRKKNILALFVSNDQDLFEKISIKIFTKLGKPTFVFLHGLPGRYNYIDENRSEYLVVWGNKIKENYINNGFDSKKIFVSGHPLYSNIKINQIKLKSSFESILVITKAEVGAPPSIKGLSYDRINILSYLWKIKNVLIKMDIKSVTLRVHPSENKQWYKDNLDINFFKIDNNTLQDSLKVASCVIGPTSTLFLESIINGLNYFIFEPGNSKNDILNQKLVPPFDGSDNRITISNNSKELEFNLRKNTLVDKNILIDYINPNYDISFLKNIIDVN